MKIRMTKLWLGAVLGLMTAAIQPAIANEWDKETRIHINAPVQIPGKVLPPGTYVFKLLDSQSNRNIVEIYSEDANGNQTFVTTTFVVSAYRLDTPDKPLINLEERHTGTPEVIHTWFYPGNNTGWEFVYPKSERLLEAENQAAPPPAAPVAVPEPPAPEEASAPAAAVDVEVEDTEVVIAQNEEPALPAYTLQEPAQSADRELPETAGYSVSLLLAAMGILGLGLTGVLVGCRQSA